MQENITKPVNNTESQEEKPIDIKAIFYLCLANWYWFVISVVVVFVLATLYLYRTTPVYTRSAKVLVKSEEKGKSIIDANDFASMGLIGNRVSVANEVITFNSIDNIREVARRLHLDMDYTIDGRFHPILLYDNTLPVNVDLLGGFDNVGASFDMRLEKAKG